MNSNIISVVGARPNFIKLAPIHKALDKRFYHIIIHTGQHYNYEMSKIFFEQLNLPDPHYNLGVGSGSHGYQLGEMVKRLEKVFLKENPETVLVYGDTNSTIAGALAAVKNHIFVAHVEAGLRSFDMRMPEEVNRILTDHASQYLFAPTKTAFKNLMREHVQSMVFFTGDVMVEVLNEYIKIAEKSNIIQTLDIKPKGFILVTVHRAENTDDLSRLSSIVDALTRIKEKIVFPIHPRTVNALKNLGLYEKLSSSDNIIIIEPLGYIDFIKLEKEAKKIVTDSGGIQKEAYLLGVPCITLRENTEWIETVKSGWNTLLGVDVEKIVWAINKFKPYKSRKSIFGDGKASEKIARILSHKFKKKF